MAWEDGDYAHPGFEPNWVNTLTVAPPLPLPFNRLARHSPPHPAATTRPQVHLHLMAASSCLIYFEPEAIFDWYRREIMAEQGEWLGWSGLGEAYTWRG